MFLGPLFEGFVASEIVKRQLAAGKSKTLYYFRDQQGLEVDFIVPCCAERLALIEAKASATPMPDMARSLLRLKNSIHQYDAKAYVVCRGETASKRPETLCPDVWHGGIESLDDMLELL